MCSRVCSMSMLSWARCNFMWHDTLTYSECAQEYAQRACSVEHVRIYCEISHDLLWMCSRVCSVSMLRWAHCNWKIRTIWACSICTHERAQWAYSSEHVDIKKFILQECAQSIFKYVLKWVCSSEHIFFHYWACSVTCSISWACSLSTRVRASVLLSFASA